MWYIDSKKKKIKILLAFENEIGGMSCESKDKNSSEVPTYSEILDKIRKETVQKDEAGVEDTSRLPDTPDDDT